MAQLSQGLGGTGGGRGALRKGFVARVGMERGRRDKKEGTEVVRRG